MRYRIIAHAWHRKKRSFPLTCHKSYGIMTPMEKLQDIDGEEVSTQKGDLKKRTQFSF